MVIAYSVDHTYQGGLLSSAVYRPIDTAINTPHSLKAQLHQTTERA